MENVMLTKDKFVFCQDASALRDKKLETKPVGFFRDVFRRFCKNKGSVVAGCIIIFLVLFALLVPLFCSNAYNTALTDLDYAMYRDLLPKSKLFSFLGWDGGSKQTVNANQYLIWQAMEHETGHDLIMEVYREAYTDPASGSTSTFYDVRIDSYYKKGVVVRTVTLEEYEKIQAWQNETGIQVLYPAVDVTQIPLESLKSNGNVWYLCNQKGVPILDGNGNFQDIYLRNSRHDAYNSLRVAGDDGSYAYSRISGTGNDYTVRIDSYTYFQYKYGFEPCFLLGTNDAGQDMLTRLASGARFSLLLAIFISSVNLFIGAIIGAIMGYYGGAIDLFMDRALDILGGVPFMVVTTLFQLHLAAKVGPVVSLMFAFFLTGWIGMASRVRMQFYRFKNQEYILAARTLGAKDGRLMFRHIFPNAIGTIITGSILSIPGVIFSESSLTYLGIVDLESSTLTSIGTMLSAARSSYTSFPHIFIFPALFIALLEISFNLFGNGLRDAFNPSMRGVDD